MPPRGAPSTTNARRLRGRAIGDLSSIADGEVLVWDAGAAEFVPGAGGGGAAALGVGMVVGVAYGTANGDAPPAGCLWAEGQDVSRTTYAELFASIGTTWGSGDGSTTFGLPDLRGRTLLGRSAGGSPTQVGATGGSRDATLVAHSHGITDGSNQLARGNGSAASGPMIQGNDGIAATGYSTDSQGSSATDANLPPYGGVRWAIVYATAATDVPRAVVGATATQSIGLTQEPLDFAAVLVDTDGMADLGADDDRLTIQTDGTYEVTATVEWDTSGVGSRAIVLARYDSSDVLQDVAVISSPANAAGYNGGQVGTYVFASCVATDYLRAEVLQSSGSNRDVGRRQLRAERIGP